VEFVGVAIWDSTVDVLRHLDRFGVTYPNALDERGLMAVGFGVRGIPEKYFFDRRGKIVAKYIGPMTSEDIHAIIDGILSSP
jgi:thioredoxin-related protein